LVSLKEKKLDTVMPPVQYILCDLPGEHLNMVTIWQVVT